MNPRIWGIIGGLALVVALLSPFVLGRTKKVERLFEAAEKLYEQNNYERAIEKYSEALKEAKKTSPKTEAIDKDFTTLVNFKIAMSYIQLAEQENNARHYQNALKYIEKAAETLELPEHKEKLTYQWGYIFYKMGQLEQALEKLKQFVEEFPDNPLVAKAQETIAQINAQLQEADEDIDSVEPTNDIPLWINDFSKFEAFNKEKNQRLVVPNRLRAAKKFAQAAEEYEVFALDYPDTKQGAYALYWAGFCYSPDSTVVLSDKSIAIFRKLINDYPESLYATKTRGKIEPIPVFSEDLQTEAEEKARQEEAEKRARQTEAKKRARQVEAEKRARQEERKNNYFRRGVAHFENRAYTQAIDSLTEALKIDSQFKEAYHLLGSAYLRTGKFECALACARKALAIDSNYQKAKDLMNAIDIGALSGECEHNIP